MSTVSSNIRDNCKREKAAVFLKDHVAPDAVLSVASAYFTVQAYDQLRDQLDAIASMRFLFGDPDYVNKIDPEKTASKRFAIFNNGLDLRDALHQKAAVRNCAEWIRSKVEIKSVINRALLHGKLYHVQAPGHDSRAMFGSSNFTTRGLGMADSQNNIELNMQITDQRDRDDLLAWFDELWNDENLVYDVKADVLDFLKKLYTNQTPEFVYFKTLYHIFRTQLDKEDVIQESFRKMAFDESAIWKSLFDFQKDGVKGIINKLKDHNGCILADSVGLGKTFTALAVIHYFRLQNERVLVLAPKKLSDNWLAYKGNNVLNLFEKDGIDFDLASHTDLSRDQGDTVGGQKIEEINWSNYGLVVIDESHNFRNDASGRPNAEGVPRKSRYQQLMERVVQKGLKTKVLLLSATPVNNSLRDLRNQIALFTGGNDKAYADPAFSLGIPDYTALITLAQSQFTLWARLPPEQRRTGDLLQRLGPEFFRLLDGLTIARARKHVLRYFPGDHSRLGPFPERKPPISISTDIDSHHLFMSYDDISKEIEEYKLSLFNPTFYVKPEFKGLYNKSIGNFDQLGRESYLIGMMKVNFLKRLESSIRSFQYTLERTIAKITQLEQDLNTFKSVKSGSLEIAPTPEIDEDTAEEQPDLFDFAKEFTTGKKKTFAFTHLRVDDFLDALQKDKRQLNKLLLQARDVSPDRDLKLAKLKQLLTVKFAAPAVDRDGLPNRKALVFTAFADTAQYLYDNLQAWALENFGIRSALVSGSKQNQTNFRPEGYESQTDYNRILIHFSPRSKKRALLSTLPQEGEIDLLIATDCISEGQNLQDCDTLVNYDIHWNPVRIIQRFGRIDRIGSRNAAIQLVNFWPTDDLNKYIKLKHRVESRMALVDITATQEDNLLSVQNIDEIVDAENIRYRDRQLLRLRDEVIDLEDPDENFSLSDFSLEDFRADLLKFLENNKKLLEEAPLGLYAVVPPQTDLFVDVAPGVVFCFRQKTTEDEDPQTPLQINPLHPCYLVYIQDNGNVRYSFGLPKKILGLYRELCSGKTTTFAELCDIFDKRTHDGSEMTHYDSLLKKALVDVAKNYRRRIASGLASSRAFVIPTQDASTDNFELLTWLVILDPKSAPPETGGTP